MIIKTMREQFAETIEFLLQYCPNVVVLLGDIGTFALNGCFEKHPSRVINVGVCEQTMVGMAAGMAKQGLYPIVMTIESFLLRRAYEQILIDFGYQNLPGMFVTVGASYDYAQYGPTHHCPEGPSLMLPIENMRIYIPGHSADAADYMCKAVRQKELAYVRLSEDMAETPLKSTIGISSDAGIDEFDGLLVIAVGPTYRLVEHLDHDIFQGVVTESDMDNIHIARVDDIGNMLHLTDTKAQAVLVLEPFLQGTLRSVTAQDPFYEFMGVKQVMATGYGTRQQQDDDNGVNRHKVESKIKELLHVI